MGIYKLCAVIVLAGITANCSKTQFSESKTLRGSAGTDQSPMATSDQTAASSETVDSIATASTMTTAESKDNGSNTDKTLLEDHGQDVQTPTEATIEVVAPAPKVEETAQSKREEVAKKPTTKAALLADTYGKWLALYSFGKLTEAGTTIKSADDLLTAIVDRSYVTGQYAGLSLQESKDLVSEFANRYPMLFATELPTRAVAIQQINLIVASLDATPNVSDRVATDSGLLFGQTTIAFDQSAALKKLDELFKMAEDARLAKEKALADEVARRAQAERDLAAAKAREAELARINAVPQPFPILIGDGIHMGYYPARWQELVAFPDPAIYPPRAVSRAGVCITTTYPAERWQGDGLVGAGYSCWLDFQDGGSNRDLIWYKDSGAYFNKYNCALPLPAHVVSVCGVCGNGIRTSSVCVGVK